MKRVSITLLPAALLAAVFAMVPATSRAGTIGFRTDAKVTAGPGLDAEVTMTHTGDEMASDVSVDAEMLGKTVSGESVPGILPGQNHVWNFHLADAVPNGAYAIVLRAHYADANGYAFEIISTAAAPVRVTPVAKLFGSLDVSKLAVGGSAEATLNLKKPPERKGPFEVRLVAPAGLAVSPQQTTIDFEGENSKATARFMVRNKDLLAGTSVNLFAFVTGSDAGFPQTDTIRGVARVTAPEVKVTARTFYTAAGVVAGALVVLELVWLLIFRGRRQSQESA